MEHIIIINWWQVLIETVKVFIQTWPIWVSFLVVIIFLEGLKYFLAKLENKIKAKRSGKKF